MPEFDRVPPAPAVKDLSKALVALVTSGGIVPKGNLTTLSLPVQVSLGSMTWRALKHLVRNAPNCSRRIRPVYANEDPNRYCLWM